MSIQKATSTDRQWHIYTLGDPRDGIVRYVGVTHCPKTRLNDHLRTARRGDKDHKSNWIRTLLASGLRPTISFIEEGKGPGWVESERQWIALYRDKGAALTNLTDGGEGRPGAKHSAESIQKMREVNRGKIISSEARQNMRLAQLGRKQTPEHIAKTIASLTGKKRSPEVCAAQSLRQLGRRPTEETRKKQSAARKGRKFSPLTPEHREKIAEANRVRWAMWHVIEALLAA